MLIVAITATAYLALRLRALAVGLHGGEGIDELVNFGGKRIDLGVVDLAVRT